MKGYCLLAGLLTLSIASFAQNTFPTNGNVGIGTTNPLYNLDLIGSLRYGVPGNYGAMIMGVEASPLPGYNQTSFMIPSTVPGSGQARSTFRFKSFISSPGENVFDVIVDGNVGIGSVLPDNKLTVRDNNPFVDVQTSEDGQKAGLWMRFRNSTSSGTKIYYSTVDAVTYLDNLYPNQLGTQYGSFNVRSKNDQGDLISRLFVHGINGNVGIGTSLPDSKLSVKGKIRAQEIKVEVANWPDYVFAKDYELPTLKETEKHIKEKGHLPGVPSAEEVKAKGVDLGEMNAKLLQKIEELTLHLIDMEKKNAIQQKLNDDQNKEFKAIITELKSKIK